MARRPKQRWPGVNEQLAFECSSYADAQIRIQHRDAVVRRREAIESYQRLSRRLWALHDKIYHVLKRGGSVEFLHARADQVFLQKADAAEEVELLELALQERWDALFIECYKRLRVIEGG